MIPYGHQTIDSMDKKAVMDVLNSDLITSGPKTLEFEKKLCAYTSAKYAVAVCNGTAALHLAYRAINLKRGDEVITTPNTFVATSNMLLVTGAKPIFCDIRLNTYNIDEKKIEKLITERTKAIAVVHFAGQPCEMKFIWEIAKKYHLFVIEDACHAFGARYKNFQIGNGKSDIAVFSFHPVKPITTGEGGAILTNNKKFYEKMKLLRNHGIKKDANGFNVMSDFGYNYRMTEMQAALGISQIDKLPMFLRIRHNIVKIYEKKLGAISDILLPKEQNNSYSTWHLYVIRTKKPADRMKLYRYLLKNNIGASFHYPCVYKHPYYQRHGFQNVYCANAEKYAKTAITIPLHQNLTPKEVNYICKSIANYFKK